jgi:hypothetical protein
MHTYPHRVAAAALALIGGSAIAAPAHADSAVEPEHSFTFVVDNGVCDFPVEYSGSTRALGLDTEHGFITVSPTWSVTVTNVDTGASWSPSGNGAITYREDDDGTFRITATGVNIDPGQELLLKGSWSRTFYPDGSDTGWVGTGQLVDICAQLT